MSKQSENLDNKTATQVTAANEVRSFLCAIPRTHHDTRETWLRRAGSFLGLTPRRARSVWYGEKVRIDADEYLRMRARIDQLKKSQIKRRELLNDVDDLVGEVSQVAGAPARRKGLVRDDLLREGRAPAWRPSHTDGQVLE